MALSVAKVTFSLDQLGYGWTENYFLNNPSTSFDAEFVKAQNLGQKRIAMCGAQTFLRYIKISREDVKRDVLVFRYTHQGDQTENSDAPDVAILLRRYGDTPVANSGMYLRGNWDTAVTLGGLINAANAEWQALFLSYRAQLIADDWGFVAKDSVNSFADGIANVVQAASGTVTITTDNPVFVAFANGTLLKCFVSGVQGAAAINGSYVFKKTGASTVTSVNRIPVFPYTTGGKITHNEAKFFDITDARTIRVVERKVGRPLYLSRGRRGRRRVS